MPSKPQKNDAKDAKSKGFITFPARDSINTNRAHSSKRQLEKTDSSDKTVVTPNQKKLDKDSWTNWAKEKSSAHSIIRNANSQKGAKLGQSSSANQDKNANLNQNNSNRVRVRSIETEARPGLFNRSSDETAAQSPTNDVSWLSGLLDVLCSYNQKRAQASASPHAHSRPSHHLRYASRSGSRGTANNSNLGSRRNSDLDLGATRASSRNSSYVKQKERLKESESEAPRNVIYPTKVGKARHSSHQRTSEWKAANSKRNTDSKSNYYEYDDEELESPKSAVHIFRGKSGAVRMESQFEYQRAPSRHRSPPSNNYNSERERGSVSVGVGGGSIVDSNPEAPPLSVTGVRECQCTCRRKRRRPRCCCRCPCDSCCRPPFDLNFTKSGGCGCKTEKPSVCCKKEPEKCVVLEPPKIYIVPRYVPYPCPVFAPNALPPLAKTAAPVPQLPDDTQELLLPQTRAGTRQSIKLKVDQGTPSEPQEGSDKTSTDPRPRKSTVTLKFTQSKQSLSSNEERNAYGPRPTQAYDQFPQGNNALAGAPQQSPIPAQYTPQPSPPPPLAQAPIPSPYAPGPQPSYDSLAPQPPYNAQGPQAPYNAQAPQPPNNAQAPRTPYNEQSPQAPYNGQAPQDSNNAQAPRTPYNAQAPQPQAPYNGQAPQDSNNAQAPRAPYNAQAPQTPYNAQAPQPQAPYNAQAPQPQAPYNTQAPQPQAPYNAQAPQPQAPYNAQAPQSLYNAQAPRPPYNAQAPRPPQMQPPNNYSPGRPPPY